MLSTVLGSSLLQFNVVNIRDVKFVFFRNLNFVCKIRILLNFI